MSLPAWVGNPEQGSLSQLHRLSVTAGRQFIRQQPTCAVDRQRTMAIVEVLQQLIRGSLKTRNGPSRRSLGVYET